MLDSIRDRLWIVREAVRANRALATGGIALIILRSALPVLSFVLTGALIGDIPDAVRDGLDSSAGHEALLALAGLIAAFVLLRLAIPVQFAIATALRLNIRAQMETRVMRAVSRPVSIAHLEDPEIQDCIAMAQGVSTALYGPGDVVFALMARVPLWLQTVGSAVILARFSWPLAMLVLVASVVASVLQQREFVSTVSSRHAHRDARRAEYFRDLALRPEAAREVRVYGLGDWLVERFTREWQRAIAPVWRTRMRGNRNVIASTVTLFVVAGIAYATVGIAGVHEEITLGAVAVYFSAIRGFGVLGWTDINDFALAYGAAAVPAIRALEARFEGDDTPVPAPGQAIVCRDAIQFENVSFRYPGAPTDVIDGLSLVIPAGHSLAIVGLNGAGKTTLMKLLCRLYEPTAGRITVDRVDLATLDPRAWHRHVTAIFQDVVRYPLSAKENIALGAIGLPPSNEQIRNAARQAGALKMIERLPAGWDTVLSRGFAGGVELSGGQWQRIGLARALIAREAGAKVLILDEPTSNLDVRAEADLYDRFLEITSGLTTLLISHRFSTVRRADRICVLRHGRMIEEGSHDELLARGGEYARLFALQATSFKEELDEAGRP
jgi:ABC-type multidrug transport system fused ATPase/permease subunit